MRPAALQELDRVAAVYRFWGRRSWLYTAQDYLTFLGRPRAVRAAAVRTLDILPTDRVLEVGCGSGRNLPLLVEALGPDGELVAFDYSVDMLAAARQLGVRRGWRNVRYLRGDAAHLGVDGTFDRILCVLAMSAIPDFRSALDRCHDVLRPGGRLVVCDARLPRGLLGALNPVIEPLYRRFAAWDPHRDLVAEIRSRFGQVTVTEHNAGTFVIVSADKACS
jgi:ubiquinone/menaquinone biosynthesis C-methylase UbiE